VLLFVPEQASALRQLPLVIDLHGSGSNGEGQARVSRLADVGAKHGFVVANPSGGIVWPESPQAHFWHIPGTQLAGGREPPASAPDDVQFIGDLIDQVSASTCIDARRIYVTGFSGGARMASLLACRLSERIAAAAPVAGLRAGMPSAANSALPDPATCQPSRPVPIVTFHGTADSTNPYSGGGTQYWQYSVPAALQRWVAINQCQGEPVQSSVTAHVMRLHYSRCAAGAEVVLHRVDASAEQGGGHTWPGSIPRSGTSTATLIGRPPDGSNMPSSEVDASELMWQFFEPHQLP
jgi:polyhydroxybutyrate depolymerase